MKLRLMGRMGLAAVALAALPLTTGCQTRLGAAADVGDQQIATSQLTAVTGRSAAALQSAGSPVPAGQEAALQRSVLNLLVRNALLQEIGKAQGLSVSPTELTAERASEARQAGGDKALVKQLAQGGVSATDVPLVVREKLLIGKLQTRFGSTDSAAFAKSLTAAAQQIGVRINPRFGHWDSKTLTVVGAKNDLSSTVTKS